MISPNDLLVMASIYASRAEPIYSAEGDALSLRAADSVRGG
jgi:hypothetical protein